jgi:hypothetical protein
MRKMPCVGPFLLYNKLSARYISAQQRAFNRIHCYRSRQLKGAFGNAGHHVFVSGARGQSWLSTGAGTR